jgi:uncharacterized protein (TIGR00369 family)
MGRRFDHLQKAMRGEASLAPIADLIGFTLASVERGAAVLELQASDHHANPMGTLHGGVLCDVADAAMGIAFASTLEDDESFTTLELKINYLRPVWKDKLRAKAKVVSRGRTVGMVECDIFNSADTLVARSSSTCIVLRGDQAMGR